MTAEDKVRKALLEMRASYKGPHLTEILQFMLPHIIDILATKIAEEFGGPDSFEYKGWTCERIVVENIPREHRHAITSQTREQYGYRCSRLFGGETITKYISPESSHDVTKEYAIGRIDFWERWVSAKGDYNGVSC